jgi:anti-sigma factor (TIGR02949 family)
MSGTQPETLEYNQCQEAVKRLTEYLSNELQPEEEEKVQKHLSECRGCFSKFHFEETLLKTIRERVEQVRAPGALRERILGLLSKPDAPGNESGGTETSQSHET